MSDRMSRDKNGEPAGYQGAQSYGLVPDMIHASVNPAWLADDNLWVPQSEDVFFKPLMLNASQGYFVNLLRVRKVA